MAFAELQDRYEVHRLGPEYVIRDMAMRAFCSLDGRTVLRWSAREKAQGWLDRCVSVWGHHPNISERPDDLAARERNRHVDHRASPWLTDWHDR